MVILFLGVIMSGGDKITSYVPNLGIQESFCENRDKPIWKVRYTSNGSFLYSVCEGGVVRKYRRYPDRHEYLGEVYTHKGDIQDLDISPYDECILLTYAILQKQLLIFCILLNIIIIHKEYSLQRHDSK